MARKNILSHIFYLFHPNFIQDETEPKGYRLLDGGKWVVEWDVYKYPKTLFSLGEHYTKKFNTEEAAIAFYNTLMKRCKKSKNFEIEDPE